MSVRFRTAHVQFGWVPDHEFTKILGVRSAKVSEEVSKHLSAQGFRKASIERLEKSSLLCGRSVEARLQSRILWLLNLNESQTQVRAAMADCSPILGDEVVPSLKQTVHWLSDFGLSKSELAKAFTTCPTVFIISAKQNLQPTVQWLLDLGLSQRQIVKVIDCFFS